MSFESIMVRNRNTRRYEHFRSFIVPAGESVADSFRNAGCARPVRKSPIASTASGRTIPNQFVLEHADDGTPLGIVGKRYKVFQAESMIEFFEALQGFNGFRLQALTPLQGGSVIVALAEIGDHYTFQRPNGQLDESARFLMFAHSYGAGVNGNAQLPILITPSAFRLSCMNQLPGLIRQNRELGNAEWRIRHTASAEEKVEAAKAAIAESFLLQDDLFRLQEELDQKRMNTQQVRDFAEELLLDVEGSINDAKEKLATRSKNRLERSVEGIVDEYQNESVGNLGLTANDALQGVTGWLDHRREMYRKVARTNAGRFQAATLGDGPRIKRRAVQLLTRW